jgi:hypothetical protein
LDAQSAIDSAAGSAVDLHRSFVKNLLDSNRLEQLSPLFSIHSLTIHVQGSLVNPQWLLTSGLFIAELIDSDYTQGETLPFLVFLGSFKFLDDVRN